MGVGRALREHGRYAHRYGTPGIQRANQGGNFHPRSWSCTKCGCTYPLHKISRSCRLSAVASRFLAPQIQAFVWCLLAPMKFQESLLCCRVPCSTIELRSTLSYLSRLGACCVMCAPSRVGAQAERAGHSKVVLTRLCPYTRMSDPALSLATTTRSPMSCLGPSTLVRSAFATR